MYMWRHMCPAPPCACMCAPVRRASLQTAICTCHAHGSPHVTLPRTFAMSRAYWQVRNMTLVCESPVTVKCGQDIGYGRLVFFTLQDYACPTGAAVELPVHTMTMAALARPHRTCLQLPVPAAPLPMFAFPQPPFKTDLCVRTAVVARTQSDNRWDRLLAGLPSTNTTQRARKQGGPPGAGIIAGGIVGGEVGAQTADHCPALQSRAAGV